MIHIPIQGGHTRLIYLLEHVQTLKLLAALEKMLFKNEKLDINKQEISSTDLVMIHFNHRKDFFQLIQSLREIGPEGRFFPKHIWFQYAKQLLKIITR